MWSVYLRVGRVEVGSPVGSCCSNLSRNVGIQGEENQLERALGGHGQDLGVGVQERLMSRIILSSGFGSWANAGFIEIRIAGRRGASLGVVVAGKK